MTEASNVLRETFRTATDKDLVVMASRRAMEHSVVLQLTDVPADQGIAMGIEFLLREPVPGELPDDVPEDPTLNALRDELRSRVAARFGEKDPA